MSRASHPSARLDEIIDEFAEADPRERLEYLLEFSEKLPPLPPQYAAERDSGDHRVHECQTPVFLWVELTDGRVRVWADVPPESPTVRGFVAILQDALTGATPEEVLSTPADLVQRLGLVEALGMMRMRGLNAILHRVRREVQRAA